MLEAPKIIGSAFPAVSYPISRCRDSRFQSKNPFLLFIALSVMNLLLQRRGILRAALRIFPDFSEHDLQHPSIRKHVGMILISKRGEVTGASPVTFQQPYECATTGKQFSRPMHLTDASQNMTPSIQGKPKVLALMRPKAAGADFLEDFESRFHLDVRYFSNHKFSGLTRHHRYLQSRTERKLCQQSRKQSRLPVRTVRSSS